MSEIAVQRWVFDRPLAKNMARDCPDWIWFANVAWDNDKLLIHQLEGIVVAQKGQTICRNTIGEYWVEDTHGEVMTAKKTDRFASGEGQESFHELVQTIMIFIAILLAGGVFAQALVWLAS